MSWSPRCSAAAGSSCGCSPRQEEARLAFIGAARRAGRGLRAARRRPLGVADVGGGSSELVVGAPPGEISWVVSLPLGSGDLADACLRADPPARARARRRPAPGRARCSAGWRCRAPPGRWRSAAARPRCAGWPGAHLDRPSSPGAGAAARPAGRGGGRALRARRRARAPAAGRAAHPPAVRPRSGCRWSWSAAACARASCWSWR